MAFSSAVLFVASADSSAVSASAMAALSAATSSATFVSWLILSVSTAVLRLAIALSTSAWLESTLSLIVSSFACVLLSSQLVKQNARASMRTTTHREIFRKILFI